MLILPAIDLRNGKAVRLHQGDYAQETIYGEDPVAVAAEFITAGAKYLHTVDLDGAKSGQPENLEILRSIAALGVPIQTGGGIRDIATIERLFAAGIDRVILGSILIKNPELAQIALREFGEKIVAGLDVRDEKIAISGWQEQTLLDLYETAAKLIDQGCRRFVVTDIATDGTLKGPNLELATKFLNRFEVNYIVSGGVGSFQDLVLCQKLLPQPEGVITGKAIYDGRIDINQTLDYFRNQ
jgi:phosphoribosylformimino-5-aminoimidazole carboxamide ribotide isomerase